MGVCRHFRDARCKSRHAGQDLNWELGDFCKGLLTKKIERQPSRELPHI